jgi:hypothetical protein
MFFLLKRKAKLIEKEDGSNYKFGKKNLPKDRNKGAVDGKNAKRFA